MKKILLCLLVLLVSIGSLPAQGTGKSHPPLRSAPPPSQRPLADGPAFFVESKKGDDNNAGAKDSPWRTVNHALAQLKPGDTLYLRGGTYYENVIVSRLGRDKEKITLRSFPGEQAILDGGLREFSETPADAWEVSAKSSGEYRSKQAHPNLRDVMGTFGDSLIGLHTYHHAQDLRAANELWDWEDPSKLKTTDIKPVYCGPGLWYDDSTGRIHVRLAHTHLKDIVNYQGETDPRKLPLIVAPFRSVPLLLDGAKHIRVKDLVIRGGGFCTVQLRQCADIELDNVTVFCGTYGMRIMGTHRLRLVNSGLHGSVPPWTFRTDTSLRSYPGRPYRDITRFGTHALLVPEAGREYDVFSLPINDDWEIAHCDFTDGHDGIYLGGVNVKFHHNRLFDLQDDGIYLSPMYSRVGRGKAELNLYQNYIGRSLTALAFGGPEKVTEDTIWFYRNIVDLRQPLQTGRPTGKSPESRFAPGHLLGDHGSPPWSTMHLYHNTILGHARRSDMGLVSAVSTERPRRAFNNIVFHLDNLPGFNPANPDLNVHADGNLYWSPGHDLQKAASYFKKFRASANLAKSKKFYPPGFDANSLVADPKFVKSAKTPTDLSEFQLEAGSPAHGAGVVLSAEWPDPLRKAEGKPDVGALPAGLAAPHMGRLFQK